MGKHPDYVKGFKGSMSDLAKAVSNMSYDKQVEFLAEYYKFTELQAREDKKVGKSNLTQILFNASNYLNLAGLYFIKAWEICESRTEKIKRNT